MKQITFSHEYPKMGGIAAEKEKSIAVLLEVFRARTEELSNIFIQYDTTYFYKITGEVLNHFLPKGEVLILLLKSGDKLWTTIRRYTPNKHKYYLKSRGEIFKIVIEEDKQ